MRQAASSVAAMTSASLCAGISTVTIGWCVPLSVLGASLKRSQRCRKNIDVVIHMMLVTIG